MAELQFQGGLNTFTNKLEIALHQDAMSMARGQMPTRQGDSLTADQQKQMQDAATEFLKGMPVGALSPEIAAGLQEKLKLSGIDTRDIATTKLGDLGNVGGDVLKSLVGKLKADSPAAFYSLAATAAAAAGAVAWSGGSAKLEKLGIKPEIKQGFFDDKLTVKLKADFGAHFSNLSATATVGTNLDFGDAGKLTGSLTANSRTGFEGGTVGYSLKREDFNLSANANFDRHGLTTANATATWNPNENLSLSGSVSHNFVNNTTSANAEALWHANQNTDFALSASHNSNGSNQVGVGVRIKF
jgi:hypothetical protein